MTARIITIRASIQSWCDLTKKKKGRKRNESRLLEKNASDKDMSRGDDPCAKVLKRTGARNVWGGVAKRRETGREIPRRRWTTRSEREKEGERGEGGRKSWSGRGARIYAARYPNENRGGWIVGGMERWLVGIHRGGIRISETRSQSVHTLHQYSFSSGCTYIILVGSWQTLDINFSLRL